MLGSGHIQAMVTSVKQNIALKKSNRNKFKGGHSKGIYASPKKDELKFTTVSPKKLEEIKTRIRTVANKRKNKFLTIVIVFSILAFIGLYYFFDIATR